MSAGSDLDDETWPGGAEAPQGEVVFILARGVAALVACAACLFLTVLVICAKTFIMVTSGRDGLLPVTFAFICVVAAAVVQLGVSPSLLHQIYMGSLA